MTPAEFFVIAYAKIEQRTEEWKFRDTLNGVACSLLANVNRSSSTPPFKPEDFRIMKDDKRKTPEQIVKIMGDFAEAHHG